jgi:hypothetical protein
MRDFWPPSTETVSADVTLWRCFRPERLIDALTTSKLYFVAPTEFGDKFEGAVRAVIGSVPVGRPLRASRGLSCSSSSPPCSVVPCGSASSSQSRTDELTALS